MRPMTSASPMPIPMEPPIMSPKAKSGIARPLKLPLQATRCVPSCSLSHRVALLHLEPIGCLKHGVIHGTKLLAHFAGREQPAMPERPFKLIKLKKTPAGSGRAFPSEINTAQAAIAFVRSLDPETRAKLHWRVAASALNGLAAGQGSFDQAGRA